MATKVLFYTSHARTFHSLLVGYLYEISQFYDVILLSEELDSKTEEILNNKRYFPKLKKIIPVNQFTGQKKNLFMMHRYCYQLARKLTQEHKPDIVMTIGEYPFESYLRRFAEDIGAINITTWEPFIVDKLWHLIYSAYYNRRAPSFFPFQEKILFVKIRKYFGHFLYYWILPLLMGQKPFVGKPSCIFDGDYSRLKGLDFLFVFLRRDYNILLKDGMPADKICVLPHSLTKDKSRQFLKEIYFPQLLNNIEYRNKTITVLLPPNKVAVHENNFSPISENEVEKNRVGIINLIAETLNQWRIFIKPHPLIKDVDDVLKVYGNISPAVKIVNPSEILENYISISDVVVEIPPVSTAIFVASLQFPDKAILSVNLLHEIFGDTHRELKGVEYINNKNKLIEILELIRDNKYRKKSDVITEKSDFDDINELINNLVFRKNSPR